MQQKTSLLMSEEQHRRLKTAAAERGISMGELVARALRAYLSAEQMTAAPSTRFLRESGTRL